MIVYLYGADSYRRNRKLRELVNSYKNKYADIDLKYIDLEERADAWKDAADFLEQRSMFVDSKVLVAYESGAPEDEGWISVLKKYASDQKTFILISDRGLSQQAFSSAQNVTAQSQAFDELDGRVLELFIKKELEALHLAFTEEAFRFFHRYISGIPERSWNVVNELQKISLSGFKEPVSLEDVEHMVQIQSRQAAFALAREILFTKDAYKKTALLEKGLLQGEAGAYLFNSLGYQAQGADACRLAEYDVRVKSGKLEYEEALTLFALT